MTLQIPLSAESEAKLRQRAAAAGKDVGDYLREEIEGRLLSERAPGAESAAGSQQSEDWLARFRGWVQGHPARPFLADDSREAIYSDERD